MIGPLQASASAACAGTPVVAPACHDTASAVASVSASGNVAFLSSGTWSLLGTEVDKPVITARALALNFTNEGGVGGTTRLLKNIGGLWLLQSCRLHWRSQGHDLPYDALVAGAADERLAFRSLIDPDYPPFLNPTDMPATIAQYCRMTGQPEPDAPIAYARAILESLAFKYRAVLESLEELTGRRFDEIRIVGGGARNRLLKQWTADATGRVVIAGPAEATALGNIGLQMMATGAVGSLVGGARGDRSIVSGRALRAARRRSVGRRVSPLSTVRGVHLCLRWRRRPRSTCATSGTRREAARLSANPLELLRYRSNLLGADLRITNFGGGNTSSKFTLPDPLTGEPVRVLAVKGSGGDLRSIGTSGFAILYLEKLEQLIARYRGEAHEDEMVGVLPAVRVRREPGRRVDRHAAARLPAVRPRRSPASRLGIALAASANGERKLAEFNARYGRHDRLGAVAAAWLRARH